MIIGLDVGGTHTDVVLLDHEGLKKEIKVPTDTSDLFHSVLAGLDAITQGVDPAHISRIVLSTTLTTNAIAQHQLPPVGMIVSSGPGINPELYRTNPHYYPVSGSIDHRGREIEAVNPDEIHRIAEDLKKENIQNIGVVGKFSVRNPAQELTIRNILQDSFEKVFLGHRVSGSLNFPRRIATTYLNAAVYPIHKKFYKAVLKSLEAKGLVLPIRLLKADGGNMKFESSINHPTQTVLSGPAASVMGAVAFGPENEDTLVLDIGGTTTDMAVLIDQAPVLDPLGIELMAYKTLIRSLNTLSIGIGGDSRVQVVNGQIKVGPERVGQAMAYGGPSPTPTDAFCVLGDMQDGDCSRAVEGLTPLAKELATSLDDLAIQIITISCQKIFTAAHQLIARINSKPVYTVHELQEGYQVKLKSVLVLGGPANYFAPYLNKISNYPIRVVPKWTVANAIGAALARTTCEVDFFADTAQKIAEAPEENFSQSITPEFDIDAATAKAFELLKAKAIQRGANPDYLEMELVEAMQFNMIRGFNTIGKNFRIKVQVKPGLIHGYDNAIAKLAAT